MGLQAAGEAVNAEILDDEVVDIAREAAVTLRVSRELRQVFGYTQEDIESEATIRAIEAAENIRYVKLQHGHTPRFWMMKAIKLHLIDIARKERRRAGADYDDKVRDKTKTRRLDDMPMWELGVEGHRVSTRMQQEIWSQSSEAVVSELLETCRMIQRACDKAAENLDLLLKFQSKVRKQDAATKAQAKWRAKKEGQREKESAEQRERRRLRRMAKATEKTNG